MTGKPESPPGQALGAEHSHPVRNGDIIHQNDIHIKKASIFVSNLLKRRSETIDEFLKSLRYRNIFSLGRSYSGDRRSGASGSAGAAGCFGRSGPRRGGREAVREAGHPGRDSTARPGTSS